MYGKNLMTKITAHKNIGTDTQLTNLGEIILILEV
jgi:hypothetical protein